MRLKPFLLLVGLIALAAATYSVHSQITPKPLRSFFVLSAMFSPTEGSPYPRVWNEGFAVRADGSWVLVTFQPNIGPGDVHVRDIYDVGRGVHTTIEDLSKSTVTRKMSAHETSLKKVEAAVSCKGKAAGQMLGFDVNYAEEESEIEDLTNGPLTSKVKRWLAPDLGCFALKKETIFTRSSTQTVTVDTTHQAISVSFQPVDQFFAIPTDYTERSPGDVLRERSRLYPAYFPLATTDTQAIDEAYRLAHDKLNK